MKVILYQPQIPQNTGNVARSCAVSGSELILVEPLGFSIQDRWLKRAGLDYWDQLQLTCIENLEAYLERFPEENFYLFSSRATKLYTEMECNPDTALIFGSETSGLPQHFFEKWSSRYVTIPMIDEVRCLNLATSVGIGLYEGLRQCNFKGLRSPSP